MLEKDFLFKLQELLLRTDIEKAFDSANHNFLLKVLKNYGFSQDFLKWTNILLQNQELCVIDGGRITYSFPLKRGTPFWKWVQMALCHMECVNLKTNTLKIIGIHFSYSKRLENDENYRKP